MVGQRIGVDVARMEFVGGHRYEPEGAIGFDPKINGLQVAVEAHLRDFRRDIAAGIFQQRNDIIGG